VANGIWNIGTPEEVAGKIVALKERMGMKHFTIVPQFPGDPYGEADEQMARYMEQVNPLIT
jgi:alkanesulfonate monooxygenase SsuD/methylene tetrahydromethanopterin reductase-like flavin-dependent oxidoreductase (luciferase family)